MSTSSLDPARLVRLLGPVADPGVLESVVDVLAAPPVDALAEQCLGIKPRLLTASSGHLQRRLDGCDVALPVARQQVRRSAWPGAQLICADARRQDRIRRGHRREAECNER